MHDEAFAGPHTVTRRGFLATASAGCIPVPLYGNPIFRNHAFFGGRWPLREAGLTRVDYTQAKCPEADAILETCIRKVARHYQA